MQQAWRATFPPAARRAGAPHGACRRCGESRPCGCAAPGVWGARRLNLSAPGIRPA